MLLKLRYTHWDIRVTVSNDGNGVRKEYGRPCYPYGRRKYFKNNTSPQKSTHFSKILVIDTHISCRSEC